MKYNIIMEVEIEARNKEELKYMLVETYAANEMDAIKITNKKGISQSLQGIKTS